MAFETIELKIEAPLATLTLNRPAAVNALSDAMITEMITALQDLSGREDVRVLILKAAGKHFCAGHDLTEMTDSDTAAIRALFEKCTQMMNLIHALPQPVIAQVQGVATAAGCQLVATCDLVVAESGARFATPGVKIGLFCSTPMVPLSRAVGRKRALEMLLTGRFVPAEEAAAWGLVNTVVSSAELSEATQKLAQAIAQASPLTLSIGKQTFYNQIDLAEDSAYGIAKNVMTMNMATQDAQEGISAFLEKREPVWKGR